jgi:hypothetical protein
MRTRTGCFFIICCCAGLAACTAGAPKGPDMTVTTPAVGRPPTPESAQAAMSREAFTPYAGLGTASDDGLALGETYSALHTACMNDAGYGQYAASAPFGASGGGFLAGGTQPPFGPFGYLRTTEAAQYGFMGPGMRPGLNPSDPFAGLPAGAQAAAGKCFNIVSDFNDAQRATSMAGIETMNEAIGYDVFQDPNIKNATKAWSACMARNGYTYPDANTLANQELDALGFRVITGSRSGPTPGSGSGLTATQNKAQIATAVADADCTQATDLAGIYFAVQGSYEQQVVNANQQALNAAVRQYKASYARELRELPALLQTASPDLPEASRPSPAHS